jgi:hypothetical protein
MCRIASFTALSVASLLAIAPDATAQSAGQTAQGGGQNFAATLSGANEVPPVQTSTSGTFRMKVNRGQTAADFELRVNDGVRVTQAHLHCAPAGLNGPIVAFLAGFHDRGWDVDGRWVDNAVITDANIVPQTTPNNCPVTIATLADLVNQAKIGNIYANAHTVAHPGGEVRGQLERVSGR